MWSCGEFKHMTYSLLNGSLAFTFVRRQNGNYSCQCLFFSYSDANDLSLLTQKQKQKQKKNKNKKPVHFSSFKHYKMSFFKVLGYKQLIYMNYIFPSALRNNIHLFFILSYVSSQPKRAIKTDFITCNPQYCYFL